MNNHWTKYLVENKSILRILYVLLLVFIVIVLVGLFTDKHINILGIEFNKIDTLNRFSNISNFDSNNKSNNNLENKPIPQTESKQSKTSGILSEKKGEVKPTLDKNINQKGTIINGSIEATNLQIGNNNIQNNIGIQQRKIVENDLVDFFNNFPDKNIYIGFVGASMEGEIINVKDQIIKILKNHGYSNLENTTGIRIFIDSNLPTQTLSILNNSKVKGGISFYIPPAIK